MVHPWHDVDTGDEAPHVFAAIERYRTTAPDRGAHARHPERPLRLHHDCRTEHC